MTIYSRHFLSQKFGRAVGSVRMDASDTASVTIASVADSVQPQQFSFSVAQFSQSAAHGSVEELALRTAIALLHRRAVAANDGAVEQLRLDTPPWIGDFTVAPFGGATAGFARATASADDRRSADEQLESCVEHGVQLRLAEGRPAARFFMQNARIPPSVIRRVLSNSLARRKMRDPELAGAD